MDVGAHHALLQSPGGVAGKLTAPRASESWRGCLQHCV